MASKTFSQEEISQFVGGILTKSTDEKINKVAPPLLADEYTLALALGEEEIENLAKTKANARLYLSGLILKIFQPLKLNAQDLL